MSTYLEGLENRLHRHGIRVSTIKLGFVDTKMVFGKSGMFLVASPAAVAKTIVSTLRAGTGIIYVPWFWRYIMLVIVHLPAFIFKRMNL
jgi:short-subunit dehydrogenase